MSRHFHTILIGATYYALGYASNHPGCLILEETQTVGGDFHHSLHPVRVSDAGQAEKASTLGRLMREYGVWTDAGFDLLKAAPVAHEYVSRQLAKGMNILMDVRILSVQNEQGVSTVTYYCNEGICEVTASKVIDTTVGRGATTQPKCVKKTLNAFTVCNDEPSFNEKLQTACPECCILEGFQENEKLILFPADASENAIDVYQRVVDEWKKAFPNGEEKILFVADEVDAVYEGIERFEHPVVAFVKGWDAA